MDKLKYLIIGFLALIMAGCGQNVDVSLKVPETSGPNAPGSGKSVVILPFADYTYADNIASAHRRNLQVTESLTDRLVANGFGLPIQEDVFQFLIEQNIISLVAYEENHSTSIKNELNSEWSDRMKSELRRYIVEQQVEADNRVAASPGTHGLTTKTVRKIGRQFKADYIVRGRFLEYKTRKDPSWAPWKRGILPFVVGGTSRVAYGFAGTDQYDEWNSMTAGAAWGAVLGYRGNWPFDPDKGQSLFGATSANSNAIIWGLAGSLLGSQSYNSGRTDQVVVQMRIWVQEAATGNLVWTNRIRVQVAPESFFADNQYDLLFNTAIDKAVTTLVDNFVTYGL
ncbi:MAG: hypothetical protein D6B25_12895 [Desulfobulbaceae bacterium]|nr:MAG: hypothetical protein D6B25_12895 [Desulfobulbaceae bacterium]